MKNNRTLLIYIIAFLAGLAIMFQESLTKGWLSFVAVPALIIIYPIVIILFIFTVRKVERGTNSSLLLPAAWATLISLVIAYVTLVGFGDTRTVFLFGFMNADLDSPIAKLSETLSTISIIAIPFTSAIWLASLFFKPKTIPLQTPQQFTPTIEPTPTPTSTDEPTSPTAIQSAAPAVVVSNDKIGQ